MYLLELLDFLEPPVTISFDLPPEVALQYMQQTGLRKSFSYADASAAEHLDSFTVAKMADMDMLADVKLSLEAAMKAGTPFKAWAQTIMPTLQAKGWWGKDDGGNQLGSAWRLETIFRTNMQSAYAVGEWQQIKAQEEIAPYLMYDAVDDFRVRPEHHALDGEIHPVGSEFWRHYHPPNDYNCRCSVIQLSLDELEELGLAVSPPKKIDYYEWTNPRTGKVEKVAVGTGPGFDYNPGQKRYEHLQMVAQQKAAAMAADAAKAALAGLQATSREASLITRTAVQAMQSAARLSKASNAAERAAAAQIKKALAEKTPYLSKAIQKVQAGADAENLSAGEVLAIAQEQAAKAEASAQLYHYKQAVLGGKKPSAKAQAAFNALPDEAKVSIVDNLEAQLVKIKADAAAKDELYNLVANNPNSLAAKALQKIDTAGKSPVQILNEVKATVAAQKAKQAAAQGLSGYKKALLNGKPPTPAQKAAFETLDEAAQKKLLADVNDQLEQQLAALAKPSAPPPAQAAKPAQRNVAQQDLDPDDLVQTGPQGGSNPGGEFTDTSTGVKWYLKYPDNLEAMRNEVLANQLYRLAGTEMPEVRLITYKGKPAIASRIVEGLKVDRAALEKGRVPGVQEDFAIDAWLSNWDVIGPDFANTKLNALGRGVRIDPGGALRFRAQGGMKGEAFGNDVLDLESMRNRSTNPHAAAVFKHVTQGDIESGVRRILAIPDARIKEMVDQFGPLDAKEREKLLKTLLARRDYLAKKYPNARPQAPAPLSTARVTESEQAAIEASRANGVTIPTDSDMIEDHHVVITTLKDSKGKPRTRLTMKLRPHAGQKLQATMPTGMQSAPVVADLGSIKTQALEFLKGVGALAKKGEAIREKDLLRAQQLLKESQKFLDKMSTGPQVADASLAQKATKDVAILHQRVLDWTKTAKPGDPAKALDQFDLNSIPDRLDGKLPIPDKARLPWKTASEFNYNLSNISRGHIAETARTNSLPGVDEVREIEIQGGRVRYIPYGKGNSVTSEGYLQIDLDGTGVDVSRKGFDILDELNIPTIRPSEMDRLELYLERIAAVRTLRNSKLANDLAAIRQIKDQASRTEEMLLALNKDAGFDMRTSPNWNPNGVTQAFGHGRTVMMRPDFKPSELTDFDRDYVVYTNPSGLGVGAGQVWEQLRTILESGGQFASQMDRVRRGVRSSGSSVSSDHGTGGASYIFTRLQPRSTLDRRTAGIYWKGRTAARLDAFSYDSDVYGNVARDVQERRRAKSISELKKYATGSANETNFRDSISVFDDLERIVFPDRGEYDAALTWLRENGYTTWPDGRRLEDVLDYRGRK